MSDDTEILEREKLFWSASSDFYEQWVAREALFVFPSPAGILSRDQAIEGIRTGVRWSSVELSEVSVQHVGDAAVSVAYLAQAVKEGLASTYSALVGSVYLRDEQGWNSPFISIHSYDSLKCLTSR